MWGATLSALHPCLFLLASTLGGRLAKAAFQLEKLPAGMEPGLYETATNRAHSANFPNGCHVCESFNYLVGDCREAWAALLDWGARFPEPQP